MEGRAGRSLSEQNRLKSIHPKKIRGTAGERTGERTKVSGYERGTDGERTGGLMYLAGDPFREKGNGRGTDTCIWLRAC